jgi:enoyl-CoA hydratase/carnithine racemase
MSFETLEYEVRDGVARIALARPEKRNAVNATMFQELGDAAERAADDPDVRAVVLCGNGPTFCAGIDLSLLAELAGLATEATDRAGGFRRFVEGAQRPFLALASMPKPTLAAVRGHAVGAGFQLALACDLRVGAADTRFGMLELRYGLIPDLGGIHHLTRLTGPARAKELVWTGRTIEVEEAERIGLVDRLVDDPAAVEPAAEDLARAVTAHSPTAVGLAKSLVDATLSMTLPSELAREAEAQTQAVTGADHRESVAAFLEGRAPRFGPG